MKSKVLGINGEKVGEIELPKLFSGKIREDIALKLFEAIKVKQAYSPFFLAGRQASASGNLSHRRHKWKSTYGYGISRVPRKIFWRRGDRFYWVGATVSGTVKGRRAHPPKVESFFNMKKINKKEYRIAIISALAATASAELVNKRYATLSKEDFPENLPIIVNGELTKLKTKEFNKALKSVTGNLFKLVLKKKEVRHGKGKLRDRKYKVSRGALIVLGNDENIKATGVDVKKVRNLRFNDLGMPLGRLTIYTEKAIKELGERIK